AENEPLNFDILVPPGHGERRVRPARSRGANVEAMIQQLVRTAIQSAPAEEGKLHKRLVEGVERELLEQVLQMSDNVLVKAAARLGINRNTLTKKMVAYNKAEENGDDAVT